MTQATLARRALALVLTGLLCGTAGCGWNRYSQTRITVKFSGDDLLHLALIPRELPDGSPCDAQREKLMKEMGQAAEVWGIIEKVSAGQSTDEGETEVRPADLLMVAGPPELAYALRNRLRRDFKQKRPWVVSLPTQAIALVPVPEPDASAEPAAGAALPPTER